MILGKSSDRPLQFQVYLQGGYEGFTFAAIDNRKVLNWGTKIKERSPVQRSKSEMRYKVTMIKRILHVVTNIDRYEDHVHPTGLWLSELTHAWQVFDQHGFEQKILSPMGGASALEPRSLKFPNFDKSAKAWLADPEKMALLEHTLSPEEVDAS